MLGAVKSRTFAALCTTSSKYTPSYVTAELTTNMSRLIDRRSVSYDPQRLKIHTERLTKDQNLRVVSDDAFTRHHLLPLLSDQLSPGDFDFFPVDPNDRKNDEIEPLLRPPHVNNHTSSFAGSSSNVEMVPPRPLKNDHKRGGSGQNLSSFSFSEADDSVIQVSPVKSTHDDFDSNSEFVNPQTQLLALLVGTSTVYLRLPGKLLAASLNSNAIRLIIGNYEHNGSSLLALGVVNLPGGPHQISTVQKSASRSEDLMGNVIRPHSLGHNRNNSESSTISMASNLSVTTNSKQNNEERFVRYAMSTQQSPAFSSLNLWLMNNVLLWLEYHDFGDSWKETFRRNEISGNRFLELANYDSTSPVWKQFSKRLGDEGQSSNVERFIDELRQQQEANRLRHLSLNSTDADTLKAENRKSSSTLWAPSGPVTKVKSRPFSYMELLSKSSPKDSSHSHKFFRKHNRASSSDLNKEPGPQPSLKNSVDTKESTATGPGVRKSGIFSTFRKYGGDKAAEIVKQVLSSQSGTRSRFSGSLQALEPKLGSRENLIDVRPEERKERVSWIEDLDKHFDDTIPPSTPARSSPQKELMDPKYLPSSSNSLLEQKTVMLTRDNHTFITVPVVLEDLEDIDMLKKKFLNSLDVIKVGTITFHLTDFNAEPGEELPDEMLIRVIRQSPIIKLRVFQSLSSPQITGTFSSTSSDSKSFEMASDNTGAMYPATPQYLLQDPRDTNVDYLTFKERSELGNNVDQKKSAAKAKGHHAAFKFDMTPMNLSMPGQRKTPIQKPVKQKLPMIDTRTNSSGHERVPSSEKSSENGISFSVVRRGGNEIDFDKRKSGTKAPRLIPNIYSSSVTDSAVSPISASTIHTLKDEENVSSALSNLGSQRSGAPPTNLESERSASFVAKRKAPPPPSRAASSNAYPKANISDLFGNADDVAPSSEASRPWILQQKDLFRGPSKQPAFMEAISGKRNVSQHSNNDSDDRDDGFFVKPIRPSEGKPQTYANNSDSDDDFFMKAPTTAKEPPSVKVPEKPTAAAVKSMSVRPTVEEVYNNLEKYFPNTNLDKPIIDSTPDSPSGFDMSATLSSTGSSNASRKTSISRTFSNANISPVCPPDDDDQIFQGDGGPKLRRRMKTIRIVANEARIKRLASQKAAVDVQLDRKFNSPKLTLVRTNTKLWGQKVVEVTSAEIEKGFVGRIRNNHKGEFEEFAWIKGELIGRGSFGSVHLALNVTTGEMLAVKQVVVQGDAAHNSEGLDALHKEVETMKDLDHLNIVQYLGFEQKGNTYSLFLEYVAGGSISSCLKSYGRFTEPLVKFITRQVLEGLKYLHSNGILHRDLKADNLLLEVDGTCKISDFGISKKSQDIYSNNAEMSMQGTVFWMAPEVIHSMVENKKQGYSAKVDIWSLGCVVLEMFAGKRPWSNEAVISAIYKIGKTKLAPPIPEDASAEAKDFLHKCFTIDSSRRPTAAELLDHPFIQVQENFLFANTKLGSMIKFNLRRSMLPLR